MRLEELAHTLKEQGCLDADDAVKFDYLSTIKAYEAYEEEAEVESVLNRDGELPDLIKKYWKCCSDENAINNLDRDWETNLTASSASKHPCSLNV